MTRHELQTWVVLVTVLALGIGLLLGIAVEHWRHVG